MVSVYGWVGKYTHTHSVCMYEYVWCVWVCVCAEECVCSVCVRIGGVVFVCVDRYVCMCGHGCVSV